MADLLQKMGDTHNNESMALERSHRQISTAASLGIYTLPIVEKTSFELRPRGCAILRVIRYTICGYVAIQLFASSLAANRGVRYSRAALSSGMRFSLALESMLRMLKARDLEAK